MSFGKYPDVSLAVARERHAEARKLLAGGADPMALRKAEKTAQQAMTANSFRALRPNGWSTGKTARVAGTSSMSGDALKLTYFPAWVHDQLQRSKRPSWSP